ncbi:hypothetical protein RhiirA4_22789 [Rhizophagus irregularis]|uniref:Uncharacterized protein n=1 Tax=Rhizophagus irregularis TaxID=588596 RepID=A0A2I1H0E2_9GLOM|nr:hypothetical protein RhiirA4_22789 [Rhizophagus irregularis]
MAGTFSRKARSIGLALGPASRLADFAKELGKRKLKAFSSYKSLRLRNGVKKVLGVVVVSLLKDRACAEDDSPSKKKARIEEYRRKNK